RDFHVTGVQTCALPISAGGYTCFIDMPLNNLPVTTDVAAFDLKLEAMKRSSKVDFGLWGGLVPGNLDQLKGLDGRGVMGFKAFRSEERRVGKEGRGGGA